MLYLSYYVEPGSGMKNSRIRENIPFPEMVPALMLLEDLNPDLK
jgi:hypothetical protein